MKNNYNNAYAHDNVYGHVIELLSRHTPVSGAQRQVHLDLGCGWGHIAEPIEDRLSRDYVGLDLDASGLESLRERGHEAHEIDFRGEPAELLTAIEEHLNGRSVASISLIDVLEHIAEPAPLLGLIRELARRHQAVLVLSVPNFAHRDVGFKLAFGRLDTTVAGILDHTHVQTFTESGLRDLMAQNGLHLLERNDVRRARSDQAFPAMHPALAQASVLAKLLRGLRDDVDTNATVNQFVGIWLPGPIEAPRFVQEELRRQQTRPFLSVVTRTQGRRPAPLRDALLALAAQSVEDFELIVVGHKLDVAAQLVVERLLADTPQCFRERIRFLRVDYGNRTAPLNVGFEAARGEYVAILDDDDLPFAHWVETFRDYALRNPGTLVRAVAVRQECDEVRGKYGVSAARAISGFHKEYPTRFDLLEHLRTNRSPSFSIAFPRAVFQDFGVRFDESLSTTEDWDFIVRTALVCGVTSAEEITCIYRWWKSEDSSRVAHSEDEWRTNYHRIIQRLDERPILMPPGTVRRLHDVLGQIDGLHAQLMARSREPDPTGIVDHNHPQRVELAALLGSTSWRLMAPLRGLKSVLWSTPKPLYKLSDMAQADVVKAIEQIRNSTSWRATAPMRKLSSLLNNAVGHGK